MTDKNTTVTIQDIKVGQRFHAKIHNRYRAPRVLTFVGVTESGAFLVNWNGQYCIFINPNAPIVLVGEVL